MTTNHPSDVLCPLPRRIERVRVSITSPLVQPSPNGRRVGIRIVTFEACSGFTRVTARRIAQPPKVTFVTRLRSRQLPSETARQLPDLSTIIRVEPSSTDDSRLQGALPTRDVRRTSSEAPQSTRLGCCSDRASHDGSRRRHAALIGRSTNEEDWWHRRKNSSFGRQVLL